MGKEILKYGTRYLLAIAHGTKWHQDPATLARQRRPRELSQKLALALRLHRRVFGSREARIIYITAMTATAEHFLASLQETIQRN